MNERTIATAILLWLSSLGAAGPAAAQLRPSEPSPAFALFRTAPPHPPARPSGFIHSTAPDYRWEGMVIGAVALGALGVYAGNHFCDVFFDSVDKHCFREGVSLGLLGAFGGGIIGGLLGGSMPKPLLKASPDSTR